MATDKEKIAVLRERIKKAPKEIRQALFSELEEMDDLSSEKIRGLHARIAEMETAAKRAKDKPGDDADRDNEGGKDETDDILDVLNS